MPSPLYAYLVALAVLGLYVVCLAAWLVRIWRPLPRAVRTLLRAAMGLTGLLGLVWAVSFTASLTELISGPAIGPTVSRLVVALASAVCAIPVLVASHMVADPPVEPAEPHLTGIART